MISLNYLPTTAVLIQYSVMFGLVNPLERAKKLTEYWSPEVIGQVNNQYVKVAKLKGELCWHKHDNEDELFYILDGTLLIQLENDHNVTINTGEFYVVPKNTMHNPIANDECLIMLVEPVSTKHTGDIQNEKTKSIEQQLRSAD